MFSFRDLVESMEKKTCESVKQKSPLTQPLLQSISSCEAHKDCEITPRSQTSLCKVEATNETEDEWERREGLCGSPDSLNDEEQGRKGIWWRDEELAVVRTTVGIESNEMKTEETHAKKKEREQALTLKRKHLRMTSKHSNCSGNNLYDSAKGNYTTPDIASSPLSLVHKEEAHKKRNAVFSNPKVRSNRGSECQQEHDSDENSPAQSSGSPSGDTEGASGKLQYLGGSKRKVRGIDNQYKTEEIYSFGFQDGARSDCQRSGDGSLRKEANLKETEGNLEKFASQEFCLHATHNLRQCRDETRCKETSRKETVTLSKHTGSNTTQLEAPWGYILNSPLVTWPLNNTAPAPTPLITDNKQTNSALYKNAECHDLRTKNKVKGEHKRITNNSTDHKELQSSKESVHVVSKGSRKSGKKKSSRGTPASKKGDAGSPTKKSTRGLSNNKQVDKIDLKTDKISQHYKTRNIRKLRRIETENNKEARTRDEDFPSTSASSLGSR